MKNGGVIMTAQEETDDGKHTIVYRIEKDGNLTSIGGGWTKDGKFERKDYTKEEQATLKKLK